MGSTKSFPQAEQPSASLHLLQDHDKASLDFLADLTPKKQLYGQEGWCPPVAHKYPKSEFSSWTC
jgi:hypothetical protein